MQITYINLGKEAISKMKAFFGVSEAEALHISTYLLKSGLIKNAAYSSYNCFRNDDTRYCIGKVLFLFIFL